MQPKPGVDLSRYFRGFAAKRLTKVEVDSSSNQHEFQGVASLRDVLGDVARQRSNAFKSRFLYLGEDDLEASAESTLSWYDAREKARKRGSRRSAEWHAYYPADVELVQEFAKPGDLLVVLRKHDDTLLILILQKGSTHEEHVRWLLGLPDDLDDEPIAAAFEGPRAKASFSVRRVLDALGLELEPPLEPSHSSILKSLLARFPDSFPPTLEFARSAREQVGQIDALADPDGAIVAWLDAEEQLFMGFEKPWLAKALTPAWKKGEVDVDAVVATMKSALQRRRSRAGTAVELHLEFIFKAHEVRFSRNPVTEPPSRPDFVFPGEDEYRSATKEEFPRLTMLGVKSTAKDRWRQVLAEAKRVEAKHLFTLQPGISDAQRTQMKEHFLTLVIPLEIQATFSRTDPAALLSLKQFLSLVKDREIHWRPRRAD